MEEFIESLFVSIHKTADNHIVFVIQIWTLHYNYELTGISAAKRFLTYTESETLLSLLLSLVKLSIGVPVQEEIEGLLMAINQNHLFCTILMNYSSTYNKHIKERQKFFHNLWEISQRRKK